MCETSFITVTGTQMQYLATNVRQNLGFHHPPDDRDAFEGVWLIPKARSSLHFWEKKVIFFIFWREIYEKSVRYPLSFPRSEGRQSDIKGSKNHQKRLQNWHFLAFLGGFSAKGTWVSIFFGIMTYQKHWNNYWNEKKKFWNFCENAYFFDEFV